MSKSDNRSHSPRRQILSRSSTLVHMGWSYAYVMFITSNSYSRAKYAKLSHEYLLKKAKIISIDFVESMKIFEAGVRNIIFQFQANLDRSHKPIRRKYLPSQDEPVYLESKPQSAWDKTLFKPDDHEEISFCNTLPLSNIAYISYGLRPNSDDRFWKGEFLTKDVIRSSRSPNHIPFVQGNDISRWKITNFQYLEWGTERAPRKFARPTFDELQFANIKLLARKVCGEIPFVCLDKAKLAFSDGCIGFVRWCDLKGIKNRSISKSAKYRLDGNSPMGIAREELENKSSQFDYYFLLAVLNSTIIRSELLKNRRDKKQLYPDDWKWIPIPNAAKDIQDDISRKVKNILNIDPHDKEYSKLESEIDESVCLLYRPKE